ncbi:MAG: NADH-quinone oxidoreductase subunit C [Roseiarcus sp.]|jgi:NADH-quinone oxidoreductase subunit C
MEKHEDDGQRADLMARLAAIPGSAPVEDRIDGFWISAPELDVDAMAREMKTLGCRFVTMTGLAHDHGETAIIYHYVRGHETINFKTITRSGAIASLAPIVRPASWIEREINDFFKVNFIGHPNLAPLLRPAEVKEGFFREPEPGSTPPTN